MALKLVEPDFRWIEVISTAALAATSVTLMCLAISNGFKVEDVLSLVGAIAGAGIGAWLAASAARLGAKAQRDAQEADRRLFVRRVLETVAEEMQKGTTADTNSPFLDFSVHFGENEIRRHAARAGLALDLVLDANEKVDADFRALLALHTAIRTLRQTQAHCTRLLEGSRSDDFGRNAMSFVQGNRNSIRISIELGLGTLDSRDGRNAAISGIFGKVSAVDGEGSNEPA